jgi:hypothetical protein
VKYNKNQTEETFLNTYLDDSLEESNYDRYRKTFIAEFETELINEDDAIDLADRLIERFGTIRETIKIGLGIDTQEINLLDIVEIDIEINNREFSDYQSWIVKKIDPGQDKIEIEAQYIYYYLTFDDVFAEIDNVQWYLSELG